ncbi:MAG: helix-turn-helix transcriptional regulator [Hyphomonas sp.]|uniref:helix-turn-helix domain-containing protein n=1 Tax=Hyphomonas sp. TaxID=87 RepID=UPI00352798DC
MAHDETNPPETTDSAPETDGRAMSEGERFALASEIFRTRSFEGEELRMGQVLRRVREARGLDLDKISADTRLRKEFLMWVERMEVGELPKGGYLTAILGTYATYLGLPKKDVIAIYTKECGAVDEVKEAAPVEKIGRIGPERARWPLMLASAAALVVLAASAIGVSQMLRPAPEAIDGPAIVAVNGARDSLFADSDDHPVPESLPLELVAVRQGWLEVRGADGTIFRNRTMVEGESYFPRLNAGWTVSARDGGAFKWRVGDIAVGPLGPDGAQVFSVSVDEQLVRAAEAAAPTVAANGGSKATR